MKDPKDEFLSKDSLFEGLDSKIRNIRELISKIQDNDLRVWFLDELKNSSSSEHVDNLSAQVYAIFQGQCEELRLTQDVELNDEEVWDIDQRTEF